MLNLKLQDIDVDRCQLFIKNAKGRKDRVVILAESFIPLFKNYYMTYKPVTYFIENPNGGGYSLGSIRKFIKVSSSRAGIKKRVTPHPLRHSYATHLNENGVGLRYVQDLFDHERERLAPQLASERNLIYVCGIAGMELGIFQRLARTLEGDTLEQYLRIEPEAMNAIDSWDRRMIHKQVAPTRRVMLEVYA